MLKVYDTEANLTAGDAWLTLTDTNLAISPSEYPTVVAVQLFGESIIKCIVETDVIL